MTVFVDFETKSCCDLKKHGVYNYAQDLSTEVLCMAYAFDEEDVQLWTHGPLPDFTGHQIRATNAAFERLIFWYVLQKNYPLEQFYCTAAEARANCAPGSLEDVGRFASASMRKDRRGGELVRKCCLPPFNTELLPELYEYCKQDVRTMRAVSKGMRQLTADELLDYHTNERINDRGVLVDTALAQSAVRYAAQELAEVEGLVKEITDGEITSVRSRKMCAWVQARVGPQALALMTQEDGKISVDKSVRANLLAIDDPEEVPPDVADVLQCASDIWSSSVAKFQRMADLADVEDHRVRGTSVFAGGSATGRYSSHGLQTQNLVRKTAKDPEATRQIMLRGGKLDDVSATLKSMIRPALMAAPGKVLVVSDWSSIEGRVNPWLSCVGEDKLQLFRDKLDPYKVNAVATFGGRYEDVTSEQRQVGKVQELALGFSGGVGAFASMGRIYGLHVSEPEAKAMVYAWRKANPWAVAYWAELERAYKGAMRNKNCEFTAGRITYLYDGQHLWYMLPSGRVLCYPYARFDADGEISYAKAAWKPKADAKHWPRARLWVGVACENGVQAVANDLLRESLRQIKDVVLSVHDEVVSEVWLADETLASAEIERIMTTPPAWATGLPLAVEIKTMLRYQK
jgi:DNA polymerase